MNGKKIVLFDQTGAEVKSFINQVEAMKHCVDNKICNAGWIRRSLKTGEKFYYPKGKASKIRNGYQGSGMFVKWV
ncbi:hypothetical protein [Lysinibacillus piscis]|uniref:Uncharacterized protein n=1 Tax=Lysinibacillus piscis TaxID=2518931 RepID=A0ABQ5NLT3_9BACI|nr:hypothetical protein [Lysinibacillus sp. KH24]GLC89310.1 hypothetical protein LYSBPC_24370 [Lysinibacillus sp. KH24]